MSVSFSVGRPDLCETESSKNEADNLCNGQVSTCSMCEVCTDSKLGKTEKTTCVIVTLYVLPPVDNAIETTDSHCVFCVRTIICRLKKSSEFGGIRGINHSRYK